MSSSCQTEKKPATETTPQAAAASCGGSTPSQQTAKASESERCEPKREQEKEIGCGCSCWL
jgi:hypothetical protein